jgi:hypothetical protein
MTSGHGLRRSLLDIICRAYDPVGQHRRFVHIDMTVYTSLGAWRHGTCIGAAFIVKITGQQGTRETGGMRYICWYYVLPSSENLYHYSGKVLEHFVDLEQTNP